MRGIAHVYFMTVLMRLKIYLQTTNCVPKLNVLSQFIKFLLTISVSL